MPQVRRLFRQPRFRRARFISAAIVASVSASVSASISMSPSASPSASSSPSAGTVFSLEHVEGIGGNFAGEPQGLAFDVTNQMIYAMSNNSGARQVKKINLAGATLATSTNQGGSTLTIQDGCMKDGYVYVPRTGASSGFLQRFDTDLNYIDQIAIPAAVNLTPAAVFAHGSWWFTKSTITNIYKYSEDLSTLEATFDISSAHTSSYSGLAWYGNFLFAAEHTLGGDLDIWYWDGNTLTLHQELSTAGFDLYNGLAIDEAAGVLYASSRSLPDDVQKYNILVN